MRPRGGLATISIMAAAATLALSGCVSLPSSGSVRVNELPISNQAAGNQVGIVPLRPGAEWTAQEIVNGFLAASGAEAGSGANFSVAKQYLTAAYAKAWHPSPQVIDTGSKILPSGPVAHFTNGQASTQQITVTSSHLETLVDGRLQVPSGTAPYVFTFELTTVLGKWRIQSISLPDGTLSHSILLLEDSDFLRDYQPRNLYFPASPRATALVPSPIYIPDSAPLLGVPYLVEQLIKSPPSTSWLYPAVTTAFPPGTTLRTPVQVQGTRAVIDLGGAAASADPERLQQMAAQLVWTLTHSPYSGTGILSVMLQVGNTHTVSYQSDFSNWMAQGSPATESLFFQTLEQAGHPVLEAFKPGRVGAASHGDEAQATRSQLLPPGLGRGRFTAIAISPTSPGTKTPATFAGCRGRTLYVAQLLPSPSVLPSQSLASACTSLSWDDHGHLFVAAGINLFEVNPVLTGLHFIPVTVLADQIQDADIVSLKVAPDGVRVAMIVRGKGSSGVYVAAIYKDRKRSLVVLAQSGQLLTLGPDVVNPVAVSWWDADHLLVLGQRHGGGSELRLVPLDGGQSIAVPTPPGTVSVTSNGSVIAIATAGPAGRGHRRVLVGHAPDWLWRTVAGGGTPVYPG